MTTVNNSVFDRISVANAAVDNGKKTEEAAQDFGDVLVQAARKNEQAAGQDQSAVDRTSAGRASYNNYSNNKNVCDSTGCAKKTEQKADNADQTQKTKASDSASVKEKDDTKPAVEDEAVTSEEEEPADEKTADQIADILQQIIDQIKEILGVTDEELQSGMESIGMQPTDLLDPANMTQLVTALTGEDSAISLVANEELYAALQEITEMVDTNVNQLLEATGLTKEQLDAILQKLQEAENAMQTLENGTLPGANDAEIIPFDAQAQSAAAQEEGPVIIKEDNTQQKEPENLQDNTAQQGPLADNGLQTQKTADKGFEDSEAKNYGHGQGMAQNYQGNTGEVAAAAAETVESYTSPNTESIMRQLADMVKIVKNEQMTEMEMQLHPASLGTVNVSLSTKGGVVTAEFTTQNEMVKAAVESQITQLRTNLEEQGVKVDAIEVTVESHEMERNLDKDNHREQQAEEERTQRIQGSRRRSINFNAFEDGGGLAEEMQGADDATRIAMEMMAANGNSMDLLA